MGNTNDELKIKELLQKDAETVAIRKKHAEALKKVEFSPIEAQIAFIKELVKDEAEAAKFLKAPKEYALEHNIRLAPETVEELLDSVIFNEDITDPLKDQLGANGLKDLVDLRQMASGNNALVSASSVMAGAAVVAAVAAVATAVISATRSTKPSDLSAIRDISSKDPSSIRRDLNNSPLIRLPKGKTFIQRDPIRKIRK